MSDQEPTLNEFIPEDNESTDKSDDLSVGELQQLEESPIESWQLVKLGEVLSLEYGDNLPSDSRKEGNIPVYGSNGQVDNHSEAAINKPGIILGRKGSIGEIRFSDKPFWPIDTTYYITAEETDQNLRFLYYLLENIQLERLNAASAIPGLNRNDTYGLNAIVPQLDEQRKIATVLYTVDQAIEKTEEIIRQTERTQKGFIRRLFRKGISNEDTEIHEVLGEMPKSWQVIELSDVADVVMGSSPKSKYYNESGNGLPFYQGNNDFNRRNPTTNVWCTEPVKQAKKGDILISIRAPVGDLNVATKDCCIGRGLAAIRPQSIDFDYLYYHLYERNNWFDRISSGSTFDSINSSQLKNIEIKLPSKMTQEKIGSILKNNEKSIMKDEDYLNHLQRLKRGLMQDLLSGTVRTTDTNIQVPNEVAQHG